RLEVGGVFLGEYVIVLADSGVFGRDADKNEVERIIILDAVRFDLDLGLGLGFGLVGLVLLKVRHWDCPLLEVSARSLRRSLTSIATAAASRFAASSRRIRAQISSS